MLCNTWYLGALGTANALCFAISYFKGGHCFMFCNKVLQEWPLFCALQ
jgi:hypothetical protein